MQSCRHSRRDSEIGRLYKELSLAKGHLGSQDARAPHTAGSERPRRAGVWVIVSNDQRSHGYGPCMVTFIRDRQGRSKSLWRLVALMRWHIPDFQCTPMVESAEKSKRVQVHTGRTRVEHVMRWCTWWLQLGHAYQRARPAVTCGCCLCCIRPAGWPRLDDWPQPPHATQRTAASTLEETRGLGKRLAQGAANRDLTCRSRRRCRALP